MSILNDLEAFREMLLTAKKAAFSKTVLIPEDEAKEIINRIIRDFPAEFEQASSILENRDEIIKNATKEAENIKLSVDDRARIVKAANEEASIILEKASSDALKLIEDTHTQTEKMKQDTLEFIERLLEQTQAGLRKSQAIIEESKEGLKNANL